MLTVLFYILLFVLACVGLGVVIGLVLLIPQFLFAIPYIWWMDDQQKAGRYKNINTDSLFKNTANAARTYKAWLKRTPPVLR